MSGGAAGEAVLFQLFDRFIDQSSGNFSDADNAFMQWKIFKGFLAQPQINYNAVFSLFAIMQDQIDSGNSSSPRAVTSAAVGVMRDNSKHPSSRLNGPVEEYDISKRQLIEGNYVSSKTYTKATVDSNNSLGASRLNHFANNQQLSRLTDSQLQQSDARPRESTPKLRKTGYGNGGRYSLLQESNSDAQQQHSQQQLIGQPLIRAMTPSNDKLLGHFHQPQSPTGNALVMQDTSQMSRSSALYYQRQQQQEAQSFSQRNYQRSALSPPSQFTSTPQQVKGKDNQQKQSNGTRKSLQDGNGVTSLVAARSLIQSNHFQQAINNASEVIGTQQTGKRTKQQSSSSPPSAEYSGLSNRLTSQSIEESSEGEGQSHDRFCVYTMSSFSEFLSANSRIQSLGRNTQFSHTSVMSLSPQLPLHEASSNSLLKCSVISFFTSLIGELPHPETQINLTSASSKEQLLQLFQKVHLKRFERLTNEVNLHNSLMKNLSLIIQLYLLHGQSTAKLAKVFTYQINHDVYFLDSLVIFVKELICEYVEECEYESIAQILVMSQKDAAAAGVNHHHHNSQQSHERKAKLIAQLRQPIWREVRQEWIFFLSLALQRPIELFSLRDNKLDQTLFKSKKMILSDIAAINKINLITVIHNSTAQQMSSSSSSSTIDRHSLAKQQQVFYLMTTKQSETDCLTWPLAKQNGRSKQELRLEEEVNLNYLVKQIQRELSNSARYQPATSTTAISTNIQRGASPDYMQSKAVNSKVFNGSSGAGSSTYMSQHNVKQNQGLHAENSTKPIDNRQSLQDEEEEARPSLGMKRPTLVQSRGGGGGLGILSNSCALTNLSPRGLTSGSILNLQGKAQIADMNKASERLSYHDAIGAKQKKLHLSNNRTTGEDWNRILLETKVKDLLFTLNIASEQLNSLARFPLCSSNKKQQSAVIIAKEINNSSSLESRSPLTKKMQMQHASPTEESTLSLGSAAATTTGTGYSTMSYSTLQAGLTVGSFNSGSSLCVKQSQQSAGYNSNQHYHHQTSSTLHSTEGVTSGSHNGFTQSFSPSQLFINTDNSCSGNNIPAATTVAGTGKTYQMLPPHGSNSPSQHNSLPTRPPTHLLSSSINAKYKSSYGNFSSSQLQPGCVHHQSQTVNDGEGPFKNINGQLGFTTPISPNSQQAPAAKKHPAHFLNIPLNDLMQPQRELLLNKLSPRRNLNAQF